MGLRLCDLLSLLCGRCNVERVEPVQQLLSHHADSAPIFGVVKHLCELKDGVRLLPLLHVHFGVFVELHAFEVVLDGARVVSADPVVVLDRFG